MLVGRNENFRVPGMPVEASSARAVAYAEAGADCLFVPFILDHGAVAELVAAVAPKPVNAVHQYDVGIRTLADLGVRCCSLGGSLARKTWAAFYSAAQTLRCYDVDDGGLTTGQAGAAAPGGRRTNCGDQIGPATLRQLRSSGATIPDGGPGIGRCAFRPN
nr:isocitrate lyase/phosphoenolpyruvate mutase family protein [Methylorubrum zatmanii]